MSDRRDGLRLLPVPGHGTEDVVLDAEGCAWTGTDDGAVWRVDPDGGTTRVGLTGGRPLGLELLDEDRLLVCDSERGLLAMHRRTGEVEVLATHAAGQGLLVCNNAAVGPDGEVWFSDSSAVHPRARWRADLLEATCTGRLLCRRPDGTTEQWLDRLDFANGVVLLPDGGSVLVAETGGRRIRRLWLTGPLAGQDEVLVDALPGYPDNAALGSDGLVWVALASPRVRALEVARRHHRVVRRALTRLPERLNPRPTPSVHVQAYAVSAQGATLVHDLRRPADRFSMVTGVREHRGRLWLGSLEQPCLAVLDVPGGPEDRGGTGD